VSRQVQLQASTGGGLVGQRRDDCRLCRFRRFVAVAGERDIHRAKNYDGVSEHVHDNGRLDRV
jgi:hypothetical protein